MEAVSKHVLAGAAALEIAPASFLSPPTFPSATHAPWSRSSPRRSLVSSWLSVERPQQAARSIQTQTLRAPLESFEESKSAQRPAGATRTEFGKEHGLLCLQRAIPKEVLRGLEHAADATVPFKSEVLRSGSDDDWLDTLVTDPFVVETISSSSQQCGQQEQDHGAGRRLKTSERRPTTTDDSATLPDAPFEAREAVRWLKADVKRVAGVFAMEVSGLSTVWPGVTTANGKKEKDSLDVTVKLELLGKGKCPRFHLDKVPLRLICTYAGPSTEWLYGYDRWEMERNRTAPPACNLKISGGRVAHKARVGDVLIFRGQPEGLDAVGVAHRSPDMAEGQRRLVLTMDVGDIRAASSSS